MDKETIMQLLADGVISNEVAERYFPELKESERIRKEILDYIDKSTGCKRWVAWLEKQGEQKPCMIQWKGDNLKEVIDFTGKDKNFEKWFKSFEEYEKYVQEHDGIFKLFNADGSHYEVPVGAWIVKTPDGYNVASKAIFRQKSVDKCEGCNNVKGCVACVDGSEWAHIEEQDSAWSEEDENRFRNLIYLVEHSDEGKGTKEGFVKFIYRLKSLKSKNAWKPSKEQIIALRTILNHIPYNKHKEEISGLLDQINELKGE